MSAAKMIDTETFFGPDEISQAKRREAEALQLELSKHISPRGFLGLPPLLDERRLQFGLPDEIFAMGACMYQFIHIYQLDLVDTEKFSDDSLLVRPDAVRARDRNEAHRGIVVGAGLQALDIARTNGWDLGHIVNFIQLAPYRQKAVTIRGKSWHVLCMMAGDVRSSEDLAQDFKSGRTKVRLHQNADGSIEHRLELQEGGMWKPSNPWISDDR